MSRLIVSKRICCCAIYVRSATTAPKNIVITNIKAIVLLTYIRVLGTTVKDGFDIFSGCSNPNGCLNASATAISPAQNQDARPPVDALLLNGD